eukprot:s485_g6.t1
MTGTLGRCDLGGNRTSRWTETASPDGIGRAGIWSAGDLGMALDEGGTETLVQVQDGALVRVQSRAADVAGTAISACGGGMAFRTCAGLRRSSWNAISACVEISACEGMALETEIGFWARDERQLEFKQLDNSQGVCRRPIYELDKNATKEIQYELMRNLRWWTSLSSWSSSGFYVLDKFEELIIIYAENYAEDFDFKLMTE